MRKKENKSPANWPKPKVLFFVHLPPPYHGVSATNERIADSRILLSHFQARFLPISYNAEIAGIGKFRLRKLFRYFSLMFRLFRELAFFRPRLVYFSIVPTGIHFYRDAVYVALMKLFGKNILFHLHGVGIREAARKKRNRLAYRLTFRNTFLIQQSELLRADLEPIRDVVRGIYVIHNAIPSGRKETSPPPQPSPAGGEGESLSRPVVFLNISTLFPPKGQMDILLAAKDLAAEKNGPFKIVFVGEVYDKKYREELERFAAENGLAKNVSFRGPLYGEEKESALRAADVFVFPTRNESFGLVALEAMRAGLPVIASRVGSLPEILGEKTGFLYPPGDIGALASHMRRFLRERKSLERMGEEARRLFEQKFTFERFETELKSALEQSAVRESRPPTGG